MVAKYAGFASTDSFAPQFYGRFAKSSFFSFVQLALDAQLHPSFVTERSVQQGGLQGIKMLFVCDVPAMSPAHRRGDPPVRRAGRDRGRRHVPRRRR